MTQTNTTDVPINKVSKNAGNRNTRDITKTQIDRYTWIISKNLTSYNGIYHIPLPQLKDV